MMVCVFFFFFFSSRRRHTRCLSDWSSDVCSSDLGIRLLTLRAETPPEGLFRDEVDECPLAVDLDHGQPFAVPRLQIRVARDVDLVERERELVAERRQRQGRPLAEMRGGGAVEGSLGTPGTH